MVLSNLNVQSTEASPGDIYVKNGMTFTYVVDSFTFGEVSNITTVADDKVTGLTLEVAIGAEYNITVTNDTVRQEGDEFNIDVMFDNGTHTVNDDNNVKPTNFYFSSVDWDYWINEATYNPLNFFPELNFESYSIETSTSEVRFNVTDINDLNDTYQVGMHTSYRYDKARGIINMVNAQSVNYTAIIGSELNMTLRLKGFDPLTPFNAIDTITGIGTTNVATTTSTTSIPVSTSDETITVTPTTSEPVTSTTEDVSTTSDRTTTTEEPTTSGNPTTSGDITSDVPTTTTTTSTRALTSEDKETTIEKSNTTEEPSATATLPLPAFGPIVTFSGIFATLTIIRKRK